MDKAVRDGLKAAAERFARTMRTFAATRSRRTAEAVHVAFEGDEAVVAAGRPGGPNGWEPVQALMFDDDKRHPLYGDKKHWYQQGSWPITAYTERTAIESATEAFVDSYFPLIAEKYGFDN